jgi:hypothetical protein
VRRLGQDAEVLGGHRGAGLSSNTIASRSMGPLTADGPFVQTQGS